MTYAKKSLGQNFLMHAQTGERIVGAALLPDGAHVLEVGPGTGMLTKALLAGGHPVTAVEADDALAPELETTFAEAIAEGQLRIVHDDIRVFDTSTLPKSYHVVANIPYYLTGELIRQFLTSAHKPESMTLLVQKEVAERITRNAGKESLLSLSVKVYGTPVYNFTVPRGAFKPAPNVDSAVISIRHIGKDTFPSAASEEWYFDVLHAGFAHKRKKLAKNLEEIGPKNAIGDAFTALSLDPNIRPEDVPATAWRTLAESLQHTEEEAAA